MSMKTILTMAGLVVVGLFVYSKVKASGYLP